MKCGDKIDIIEIQENISINLWDVMQNMIENHGYLDKDIKAYQELTDNEKKAVDTLNYENQFGALSEHELWINLVLFLHYNKFMNYNQKDQLMIIDGHPYYIAEATHSIKAGQKTWLYTLILKLYMPYIPYELIVQAYEKCKDENK
jgi:hypothetical protein